MNAGERARVQEGAESRGFTEGTEANEERHELHEFPRTKGRDFLSGLLAFNRKPDRPLIGVTETITVYLSPKRGHNWATVTFVAYDNLIN